MEKKKNSPALRFPEFIDKWVERSIKNILSIGSGQDYKNLGEGDIPVFGTGGLMTMVDDFLYEGETVCIGRKGTIDKPMYFNGRIWTVDTLFYTHSFIDTTPKFVYNIFQKINWQKYNEASGVPSLSKTTIEQIGVSIPSLPEQQKIASFLTSVDERIAQLTKKKALLEQYKKGVMQKIFSQEIRFKDDDGKEFGEWKLKKLGIFIEQYIENSTETNQFEVFTSSNKGLMLQKDYFGENRLTDRDNVGFNIIPAGYITYRSRSDNGKFTFNTNNLGITGIISTYYPVFTIKNGTNYFFVELLNFHWRTISIYSVGTSQRVLAMSALSNIELKLPCEKEQTKIANFLSAIDKKIEGVDKQLEQTKLWKKGLLQQMFC